MSIQTPLGILGTDRDQLFSPMSDTQTCIQNCIHCNLICKQLIQHCLQMGGMYAEQGHITLLEDCAEVCALMANLMLRESDLSKSLSAVCAEACLKCGERCRRFPEDERMKACASACIQAATICGKIGHVA